MNPLLAWYHLHVREVHMGHDNNFETHEMRSILISRIDRILETLDQKDGPLLWSLCSGPLERVFLQEKTKPAAWNNDEWDEEEALAESIREGFSGYAFFEILGGRKEDSVDFRKQTAALWKKTEKAVKELQNVLWAQDIPPASRELLTGILKQAGSMVRARDILPEIPLLGCK